MLNKKILLIIIIFIFVILLPDCSNEYSSKKINYQQTELLTNEMLEISVIDTYGWFNLMPRGINLLKEKPYLSLKIKLKNNLNKTIENIIIDNIEVYSINNKYLGKFYPKTRTISKSNCSSFNQITNELNLTKNCEIDLDFTGRNIPNIKLKQSDAFDNCQETPDYFTGEISGFKSGYFKFRFLTDKYKTEYVISKAFCMQNVY